MANRKVLERRAYSVRPGRWRGSIIAGVVALLWLLMVAAAVVGSSGGGWQTVDGF